jgi:hypothetical protein
MHACPIISPDSISATLLSFVKAHYNLGLKLSSSILALALGF